MQFNKRAFSLGTIRDYILTWFPELLWWDGYNKHEPWNSERSYKHRQGMPNEIRIEFDGKDINRNWVDINETGLNIYRLGLSFAIFSVEGGRSPHIHVYDLDELETLDLEERRRYRVLFLKKICPKGSEPDLGLCDEKHLCALEFANHFKYNKPKQLLSYFWQGRNMGIDFDIKWKVMFDGKKGLNQTDTMNQKLKFGDILGRRKRDIILRTLNFEKVFDKYGVDYKGRMALCPFHNDTNLSLSFSNEKGLWNCFGCEAKGDIISLIKMLREKNENKIN